MSEDHEIPLEEIPDPSGGMALGLEQLRARRRQLQEQDDAVSYVRRVAQGRADLARAELARREPGSDHPALADDLRDVLSDRLLGATGRPPRPAEDFSDDPRSAELDQLCADHGFSRLDELDDAELVELAAVIDRFETNISLERQELFAELDNLTDELVRRYIERAKANEERGDP